MAKKQEAAGGTVTVTQTGSPIRREKDQRATLNDFGDALAPALRD